MGTFTALVAHVAAGLVLVAGVGKMLRPAAAREALALTARPAATASIRLLGLGETLLAAAVLLLGGTWPFAALSLAYVGFVVVGERQRRAGRGCGCFTSASTTVGPLHLGVDAVAALVLGVAAWTAAPGILGLLPDAPAAASATLVLLSLGVVLARMLLTALPDLLAVRAQVAGEVGA